MGRGFQRMTAAESNIGSFLTRIPSVAIDTNREAQPFRSKVDGFVPLSRHRSAVLRGDVELERNDLRERKTTLKLQSRTPSLLQERTSLPAFLVWTAESGFNPAESPGLFGTLPVLLTTAGFPRGRQEVTQDFRLSTRLPKLACH